MVIYILIPILAATHLLAVILGAYIWRQATKETQEDFISGLSIAQSKVEDLESGTAKETAEEQDYDYFDRTGAEAS